MGQINKFILASLIISSSFLVSHTAFAADDAIINNDTVTPEAATATLATQQQDIAAEKAKAEAEKIAAAVKAEAAAKKAQAEKIAAAEIAEAAAQKAAAEKIAAAEKAKAAVQKAKAEKIAAAEKAKAAAEKIAAQKLAQEKALAIAAKAVELAKIQAAKAADEKEALLNPLGVIDDKPSDLTSYTDFPEIAFNPIKPIKNPLTVYKLRNIVHTLPALDGLTRQNLQRLAKSASVIDGVKIWKAERKTLQRKLILNNYKSFWFTDSVLDISKAQEIVATVENAENYGLRPARYKLAELKQLIAAASVKINPAWMQISGSTEKLKQLAEDEALSELALNHAKLEIALSHVAFAYSRHASAGQTIPSSVDRNNDVHPTATPAGIILNNVKTLTQKGELQNWLEAQHPQSTQFKTLLAEFKKQSGIQRWRSILTNKVFR